MCHLLFDRKLLYTYTSLSTFYVHRDLDWITSSSMPYGNTETREASDICSVVPFILAALSSRQLILAQTCERARF